jgi:hypothetical protein
VTLCRCAGLLIDACGAKVKKIDFCGVSKPNVGSACGRLMRVKLGHWLLTRDYGKNLMDRGEAKQVGTLDLPHSVPGSVRGIKEQSEAR